MGLVNGQEIETGIVLGVRQVPLESVRRRRRRDGLLWPLAGNQRGETGDEAEGRVAGPGSKMFILCVRILNV